MCEAEVFKENKQLVKEYFMRKELVERAAQGSDVKKADAIRKEHKRILFHNGSPAPSKKLCGNASMSKQFHTHVIV